MYRDDEPHLPAYEEEQVTALASWLDSLDAESFKKAVGVHAPARMMAILLRKMRDYIGGRFPMYKDNVDRMRCDILHRVMAGEDVPKDELRLAVALMSQGFSAQCYRIHSLEQTLARLRVKQQIRPAPNRPQPIPRRPPYAGMMP